MTSDLQMYLEASGAKPSSNNEYVLDCPKCMKSGHLYVSTEPRDSADGRELPAGRFICFKCDFRGLSFAWLMVELDGVSLSTARNTIAKWKMGTVAWRRDAFRMAAGKAEAEKQSAAGDDDWLPAEFEPLFDGKRWLWPKYLTERKTSREVAARLKLGVCRSGEYAHRIILPIVCPAGRSFTGRTIWADEDLRYKSGPGAGQLLFGWQSLEGQDFAVIVEGPFDAMRVIEAGLPCVALLGKQLRAGQEAMLLSAPRRNYVVMLDADAHDDALGIAKRLHGMVSKPLRKDPGDSTPAEVMAAFESAELPTQARIANTSAEMGRIYGRGRKRQSDVA